MAGIYIHIPFCRQACHYCNFHFSTSLRYKNEFIAALLKELDLFVVPGSIDKDLPTLPSGNGTLSEDRIETIYFGGGTPSLCTEEEIKNILEKIRAVLLVDPNAEITLEANPDDITEEKLSGWKRAGINRLSIGVQSFFEEDLQWMNRAHDASQAVGSLQLAARQFSNITIDLIYGTPYLTNEKWKQNVDRALALNIPHLSCYALTVEPKTPLDKMIRQQASPDIDPDKQSEQFLLLMQWMEEAGYEHYEISNFAKPGFRSRHNSSYWQGKNYYGFGPSAHSFNGNTRWWNVANNNTYIQSIQEGKIPFERETLTVIQKLNEYIMISLRTVEGLELRRVEEIAVGSQQSAVSSVQNETSAIIDQLLLKSKKYADGRLLNISDGNIRLTREGKLLADGIAADLFVDQ